MLVDSETRSLLENWNHTATAYPRDDCIPALFEEQVKRTPDATAVIFGKARLTYLQLNLRANSYAHYLRELGVTRETLVALCIDRSLEMIVGLLGILKAGGAYVPLDPESPTQRLQLILADTQNPIILTTMRHAARFSKYPGHLLVMDLDSSSESKNPTYNPTNLNQPEDLAYVTYTSGSTGRPKGISIVHRGVVRLVKGTSYANFDQQHNFLQLAPLAFDASTFEIWGPLLNGATLVIAPPGILSLAELGDCVRRQHITTMFLTTGLFHQVVEYQLHDLTGLKQLLTGGDVLSPTHVRRAVKKLPACRVIPCYGPTENTTFTSCYPLDGIDFDDRVPIGRPIDNTQVYVLDEDRQFVPIGVAGELYIGGDGLAREYWRQPELSRQKFVEVEVSPDHVTRLYRSGDRVRWHADGYLEFLGRFDQQVKIRGFRIEPGEIENTLRQYPRVADVTVLPRETTYGGKRLIAFVVLRPPGRLTARELHEFLVPQLPSYMIPAEFAFLTELPLTANGKVDRQALVDFHSDGIDLSSCDPPRNPIESKLCQIWQQVLKLKQIGIHHTFLEAGGDSLLAMQILTRIGDEFHIDFSIAQFIPQGTIARQAALIEQLQLSNYPHSRSSPQPSNRDNGIPLSYPQQRLWFLHTYDPNNQAYRIVLAYRLQGPLDVALLERCLQKIVDRHDVLRTTFASLGGPVVQRISPRGKFKLSRVDLRTAPLEEHTQRLEQHLDAEARQPLDLEHGPLFRTTLLTLNDEEHVFLLVVHHLVFDGWSEEVLFRELKALYTAGIADQSLSLPPLPFQYADFAIWERRQAESAQLEAQRSYWKTQLCGAPVLLDLPTDHPRPAHLTSAGRTLIHNLPTALCQSIHTLSSQEMTTLFVTLLTAWKVLLFRYTAQNDLVVGTAVAHRSQTDLEPLVGFFANTLALRTDLSGNPTFRELIGRVQQVTLAALSHQDLPFEQVVRELGIERNPSYAPLAQIMFVLHTVQVELPGISISRMPVDSGTAKFDLTLFAFDQPDGISLWFEYNADLFSDATIQRMAAHLQQLLEAVTSDPQLPIELALPHLDARGQCPRYVEVQARRPIPHNSAPHSEIEKKIIAIWQELLGVDRISSQVDFFSLGGHSLLAVELAAKLESVCGRRVSIAQVFQNQTIAKQAHLLSTLEGVDNAPSLITIRPGSKHSLVTIPLIGGRVFSCTSMYRYWPEDLQLTAINLESRASNQTPSSIEDLAAKCVDILTCSSLAQPYHLLGYSFGGMLAYEVARQLNALGLQVGLVGIIDTGPAVRVRTSLSTKIINLRSFATNVPHWLAYKVQSRQLLSTLRRHWKSTAKRFSRVPDNICVNDDSQQLFTEGEELSFGLRGLSDEQRRAEKSHYRAFNSYVPGDYNGKITLFRASLRPLLHHFTLDAGWSQVRVGQLEIRVVPGTHTSILTEPHSQTLAREILAALNQSILGKIKMDGVRRPKPEESCE